MFFTLGMSLIAEAITSWNISAVALIPKMRRLYLNISMGIKMWWCVASQDAGVAGDNLGSNPIYLNTVAPFRLYQLMKGWHKMSHSGDGFVGFPHVYTQSNTTELFGLRDKNNWADPWRWSHSRFGDVFFEQGLHTNFQVLSLTGRNYSVWMMYRLYTFIDV